MNFLLFSRDFRTQPRGTLYYIVGEEGLVVVLYALFREFRIQPKGPIVLSSVGGSGVGSGTFYCF